MNQANEAIQSNLPKLQKQNIELQLAKKARQAELMHAENQHNQYLQLQHEHDRLEQDNNQLQFQIDVTRSKAKALADSDASTQEIPSIIDPVQGIADHAPKQCGAADYVNWVAEAVASLDQ